MGMKRESRRAEAARKTEEVHEAHQSNVNQVRHEPMPASHHDDQRPAARRRDEDASGQDESDSEGESPDEHS
jgi:hypothetical protein